MSKMLGLQKFSRLRFLNPAKRTVSCILAHMAYFQPDGASTVIFQHTSPASRHFYLLSTNFDLLCIFHSSKWNSCIAVNATRPNIRWPIALSAPRPRTNRPPKLSFKFEFTRSAVLRSLKRSRDAKSISRFFPRRFFRGYAVRPLPAKWLGVVLVPR
jgi:hypothetical protein